MAGKAKVPLGKDTSDLYRAPRADYEAEKLKDELPGVAPPSASTAPIPPPSGPVDPGAIHILKLATGGKFSKPFVVTLMRKIGVHVHKTDAGQKHEDKYEICYETVREPADLLRLAASVASGAHKHLNNNTLEFQLLMYLAYSHGVLVDPSAPAETE